MPSSDPHPHVAQPRAGRRYEDDLQLRYLAPGAFTVLPPDDRQPAPDPPPAPEPYRLTPSARRHKNQSFAILGEIDPGRPPSRGSSPTGRVSPFRGRGFNPSGSRHASPAPSPPPPEDARLTPTILSPKHSKIPQLKRRGSNNFGEKVYHHDGSSPTKKKPTDKLSASMTDLGPDRQEGSRPPPTPKRTAFSKAPAFQTLSPIAGSSPDSNKSLSSPSRIPKSRSTPPSRRQSPSRTSEPKAPATITRHPSRGQSRNQSRVQSRDSSPTSKNAAPTRTPSHRYKNVQAKVNTFNKPKVPPKPQVLSETSDSDRPKTLRHKASLNRKESVNRLRTSGPSKTGYSSTSDSSTSATKSFAKSVINNASKNVGGGAPKELVVMKDGKMETTSDTPGTAGGSGASNSTNKADDSQQNSVQAPNNKSTSKPEESTLNSSENDSNVTTQNVTKKTSSDPKEMLPSATTVVSSTTTTVTQPLKIETNLPPSKPKSSVSPMVDGRVLSATSVSNAMNKMNDSVLDTQTVIKDHGFPKLSPAANAVISMNSDPQKASALDTKNATTALPKVEPIPKDEKPSQNNHHANHVSHVMSSKALEMEVQKNLGKIVGPEGVSDKVKEVRTVVARDVQPIRITVREKPGVEVQSGNVRLSSGISNGLNERPSLPPSQQTPPNEPEKEPPPKNGCARFFSSCKARCCPCCRGPTKGKEKDGRPEKPDGSSVGCLDCLKRKKKKGESGEAPAAVSVEDETGKKKGTLLDRIKCCGKQKVKDSGCFPLGKRREDWAERRDSILSNTPPQTESSKCSKDCCKNFLKAICCIGLCGACCKKKVVEEPARKSSVMSKKKSLTPTTLPPPPEDTKPKIDMSLVEHNSVMKGAIPVLPVCLAWFCLIMNCILPGTGTFLSGLFCLCLGIPRFSQKDGPKPRIGSFLINTIIAFGQFFTVLFCLVGWGWSIWWGVIMLKVAKKHRKLKHLEKLEQESFQPSTRSRDPERAS